MVYGDDYHAYWLPLLNHSLFTANDLGMVYDYFTHINGESTVFFPSEHGDDQPQSEADRQMEFEDARGPSHRKFCKENSLMW